MENPIKMDDFGIPLFLETPISMIILRFVLCSQGLPFNVILETFMKSVAHDSMIIILNKKHWS